MSIVSQGLQESFNALRQIQKKAQKWQSRLAKVD